MNDIINELIEKLNYEDIWFTTKNDPTYEEAPSYFKLDEYGCLTESACEQICKQVEDYIGDGAVDITDAIDLWIADAMMKNQIAYKDMLVTVFKDKPVVDGIEAYENPVQLTESLTEGTTNGKSNLTNALKDLNVSTFDELKSELEKLYDNELVDDDTFDEMMDEVEEQENKCADYIERRSEVTNTDWKDELYLEADYVTSTIATLIENYAEDVETKTEDLDIHKFTVTLAHDDGEVEIETTASSKEAAIKNVCKAENAPESAVVKVKDLGSLLEGVNPKKIKTSDGHILTKVNDGLPENADIPVYANDKGDEVLVTDVNKYEVVEESKECSKQLTESVKSRLQEENNKSANLIKDMLSEEGFDEESNQGKIVLKTSKLFNALSDKGFDVQVSFDNGESQSTILLHKAGGRIDITINNADNPVKAFISGNTEISDEIIENLTDVNSVINEL